MLSIHQVNLTNRAEKREFVDFPFQMYHKHPYWVPELRRSTFSYFDKAKHPFYKHSDADFFVVKRGGRVVGRAAMLENRPYNRHKGVRAAFFGLFEVEHDPAASHMLFDQAVKWAGARSLNQIIGPRGFLGLDGKVLVDGFDQLPTLGEPYNPPYYDQLILEYGFEIESNFLTGYFPSDTRPPARYQRLIERNQKRNNFKIKRFHSRSEAIAWLPDLLALQKEAFANTRTYYPISQAEVENMVSTLKLVADYKLIRILIKEEKPVGLVMALPDISKGLKQANGRLFPFGWWDILKARRYTDQAVILAIGILPAHQGLGGNAILHAEITATFNQSHYRHIEVGPIDTENRNSINDMETQGVTWTKTHRLYQLNIA